MIPFDHASEELALALAAQAGIALENAHALRGDSRAVRRLRGRLGDRDRVARSDHLRPLAARGDADGRRWPRRSTRRRRRPVPRRALHRRRSCRRSSTPACCTTSARSACARRCWSRPRSSTRTSCALIRQRFALHQAGAGGRARGAQAARGDGAGEARAAGAARRRSTPSWGAGWTSSTRRWRSSARPTSRPCSSRAASSGSPRSRGWSTWRPTGELRPYLEPEEVAALQSAGAA